MRTLSEAKKTIEMASSEDDWKVPKDANPIEDIKDAIRRAYGPDAELFLGDTSINGVPTEEIARRMKEVAKTGVTLKELGVLTEEEREDHIKRMAADTMKDVQASKPDVPLALEKVGVSDVKYPFTLKDRDHNKQRTIGTWNMYVEVPEDQKGTHMSRFIERLIETTGKMDLSLDRLHNMVERIRQDQEARHADVKVKFVYFMEYRMPSSGKTSLIPLVCTFEASTRHMPILTVLTPVHTCCPCSKEMCEHNTHNQRGYVKISIQSKDFVWIEEIAQMAINSASAPVAPLLKRIDEKAVVEYAYRHPKFVEDVARSAKNWLLGKKHIIWFKVRVKNFESIHAHNAYAETKGGKFGRTI